MNVTFIKRKDGKNIYKPTYFNSRTQAIINSNEFHGDLQTRKQQLLNGMAVWLSEGSSWTIFSLDEHYINTAIYNPLKRLILINYQKNYKTQLKDLLAELHVCARLGGAP